MNKIAISSGHGLKIRGASGNPVPPYLDEVDEARRVVDRVAELLRDADVPVAVFHDNSSTSQSQNLSAITSWHNKQSRDLDCSVHFNAYSQGSKPMGCEVLYVTQQERAADVSAAIAEAGDFIDRGAKKRTDLAFLNNTTQPSILIETCFCDSSADANLYRQNFDVICGAIAAAISDVDIEVDVEPGPEPEPEPGPGERRTLSKGCEGDDVALLQSSLGLPDADGEFGEITETQVEAFQKACGLGADGVVGNATWAEVDDLDARVAAGVDLPDDLKEDIVEIAKDSAIADYSWPDRGKPPPGYIPGMACCYALAVRGYQQGLSMAGPMAEADTGNADVDAFAYLRSDFIKANIDISTPGIDAIRALFVLLIGLGMRESGGKYCEGRDMSASNVESDTCEAGAWQTSWNINSASGEIPKLFDYYWDDPNGFLPEFSEGVSPSANNLNVYGSGDGAAFQWLSKYSPAFAAMVCAIGLRTRRQHWGPIGRREVDLMPSAEAMLLDVEALLANGPDPEPGPEPEPGPDDVPEVNITTSGNVKVTVNGQTISSSATTSRRQRRREQD